MSLDISYHYRDEPDTLFYLSDRAYVKLLSDPRLIDAVFGDDDDDGLRLADTFVKDLPNQAVSRQNLPCMNIVQRVVTTPDDHPIFGDILCHVEVEEHPVAERVAAGLKSL